MNNNAIGIFDSGIGGLTTYKELQKLLPNEDIIYLGDTARIPYGSRSKETVWNFATQDVAFLQNKNVKMIIVACGTVSAVMTTKPILNGEIPFTGVLLPAVQSACTATKTGRIGVIGTNATIKSGAYGKAIRALKPDAVVLGKACPLFVPVIENGMTSIDNKITRMIAEEYLEVMIKEKVDTLILGCTHYPIISDLIQDIIGDGVRLISPGEEAAKLAAATLAQKELLSDSRESGKHTFYCTDSAELFSENVKDFLGHSVDGEIIECSLD